MKKIRKLHKIRKNSNQISIPEHNFHRTVSRGNSYQKVTELLDALKKKLSSRYNHLIFDHPDKIFRIEEKLLLLLEEI